MKNKWNEWEEKSIIDILLFNGHTDSFSFFS